LIVRQPSLSLSNFQRDISLKIKSYQIVKILKIINLKLSNLLMHAMQPKNNLILSRLSLMPRQKKSD